MLMFKALDIISVLIEMSGGKLLALDVTGDFTKVNLSGIYRHYLHGCQHSDEQNSQRQEDATPKNERTNLEVMKMLEKLLVL